MRMMASCLAVLLTVTGCQSGVRGSGVVKTEPRQVGGFTSIALSGSGKLTVNQTGKESLLVSAEDNLLPLLETKVVNHVLELGAIKGANINPTKPIEYMIEARDLEGMSLSGAGDIEVSKISGKKLRVKISGAGNIKIAGSVEDLTLELSGAGRFDGENLKTKQATVHSAGVGEAVVNVSDNLDVTVSGVGSVEYIGSPKVSQSISGVGSIKKR